MIGQSESFEQKLVSQVSDGIVLEDNRFFETWWSHCEDTSNSEIRNGMNITEHTIGVVFMLKVTLLKAFLQGN